MLPPGDFGSMTGSRAAFPFRGPSSLTPIKHQVAIGPAPSNPAAPGKDAPTKAPKSTLNPPAQDFTSVNACFSV